MSLDAFEEVKDDFMQELKEPDTAEEEADSESSGDEECWRWMMDGQAPRCSNVECNDEFWLIRRRHHCRPCGKIFCRECCPKDPSGVRQCSSCAMSSNPMLSSFIPTETRNINIRANHMARLSERLLKEYTSISDIPLIKLISAGPPKKIFKINREIAAGSFGRVFEARDDRVGDRVAIKIFSRDSKNQAEQEKNIAKEVLLHQKAIDVHSERSHDRMPFPRIYNLFFQKPGILSTCQTWVVMELIEGATMAEFLRSEYPMPHDPAYPDPAVAAKISPLDKVRDVTEAKRRQRSIQTLDLTELDQPDADGASLGRRSRGISEERTVSELARQILISVAWAHEAGIVFRDLKADNIMVENDPFTDKKVLRLIDFGSAMEMPPNARSIKAKSLVGSYAYMAPETWQLEYSPKSDVWGIGCLVHELAMGVSPFQWVEPKLAELVAEMKASKEESKRKGHEDLAASVNGADEEPVIVSISEVRQRMFNMHSSCEVKVERKGPQSRAQQEQEDILCWSQEFVDFIGLCFCQDPEQRPTCKELLNHSFIRRYTEERYAELDVEEHYASIATAFGSSTSNRNDPMMMITAPRGQ
eukprot:TRINITY_DN3111_c1_g3_i1.p1 TRINITY_DN3111_c1_g3~~TRINITY_DN3111_c1_g3_i1.p1  ORF type:complete len:587 (+),score=152.24 TRINITY_DN3111_c1_g3_i1:59-1819(+)